MRISRLRCPQCNRPVEKGIETFPFCSRRCQLTDLGRWASGEYRIAGDPASIPEDDSES